MSASHQQELDRMIQLRSQERLDYSRFQIEPYSCSPHRPTEYYYVCPVADMRTCQTSGINPAQDALIFVLSDPGLVKPFALDWYGDGNYAILEMSSITVEGLRPATFFKVINGLQIYDGFVPPSDLWLCRALELARLREPVITSSWYSRSKWFQQERHFKNPEFRAPSTAMLARLKSLCQAMLRNSCHTMEYDFSFVWQGCELFADLAELPSADLCEGGTLPQRYATGLRFGNAIAAKYPKRCAELLTRWRFIEQYIGSYCESDCYLCSCCHCDYQKDESRLASWCSEISAVVHSGCIAHKAPPARGDAQFAMGILDGMTIELSVL